jgi:alpha-galactosidase
VNYFLNQPKVETMLKMTNAIYTIACLISLIAFNQTVQAQIDTDPTQELPDPGTEAPNYEVPVKVYILMGQSNMVGFGKVEPETEEGTLAELAKVDKKYPHVIDDDGNWTVRNDVWCVKTTVGQKQNWLQPSFGARNGFIGPEYQFGHVMGHVHDEPVLIIKASQGNRSLGWDILPPGSEQFEFEGRVYAGYKDTPDSWVKGEAKKEVNWYAGKQYDDFVRDIHEVLNDLPKFYPDYKEQGYEIAGFAWWQGHKDQNAAHAGRYEQNMVRLINSLREEFEAPDAPFAIATIAFGGEELKGHGLTVANAQLAVSGESGKYPEFAGNVKTVEARGFWREAEVSPKNQGYHYNHNAETYMEVGNALGWAMADMRLNSEESSNADK